MVDKFMYTACILDTGQILPPLNFVEKRWTNTVGDIGIVKSRIWARISTGTYMYMHCDFRRETDPAGSAINILQWEYHAVPGNQFNGHWLDHDPPFELGVGETLISRYRGSNQDYEINYRIDIHYKAI